MKKEEIISLTEKLQGFGYDLKAFKNIIQESRNYFYFGFVHSL